MESIVLVCTVGGSRQPVVTAIRELAPAHVCFLCTDRDPTTGQQGSRVQVEGKGSVIKARTTDPGPTLPNIPTQAGLGEDAYEVRLVAADDLDAVAGVAAEAFTDLAGRHPGARLLADYTGGTKTMTAGLTVAALERPDVELHLVTGARADLVRVHDGTQAGASAVVERIRLHRAMAPHLAAWAQYAYGAAALGLEAVKAPRETAQRAEWQIACHLSRAFDSWDRFDHPAAQELLVAYRPRIGRRAGLLLKFLEILVSGEDDPRREPARLFDLWLNAQRRAAQGRYDDAVARAYRLLEWSAQWLLRARAGIRTGDVAAERVPADITLRPGRDGRLQAGLFDAWALVAGLLEGPSAAFAREQSSVMLDHLKARNASILAHGFEPIDQEAWERFSAWLESAFLPVLRQEAIVAGFRMDPPQLPDAPVW